MKYKKIYTDKMYRHYTCVFMEGDQERSGILHFKSAREAREAFENSKKYKLISVKFFGWRSLLR